MGKQHVAAKAVSGEALGAAFAREAVGAGGAGRRSKSVSETESEIDETAFRSGWRAYRENVPFGRHDLVGVARSRAGGVVG